MQEKQDLITVVAANIAGRRKALGMTQMELAEKLGYSDKNISKWERAEGVPDIFCLKQMAELFGVSVDALLTPEGAGEEETAQMPQPRDRAKSPVSRSVVTAIVLVGVWTMALLVHLIGGFCGVDLSLALFAAIPVSGLLLIIFNGLWGRAGFTFWVCSFFVVSLLFLLCWILRSYQVWLLMLLAIPAVLVVWLCCRIRR